MKTLTFYSGKLWHSDKPFPALNVMADPEMKDLKVWLSTAYEVVNPEVLCDEKGPLYQSVGGFQRDLDADSSLVDGDHITLPEGYGIKCNEVPCVADPNTGQCNSDCKCGFRFATITLPEKIENWPNPNDQFKSNIDNMLDRIKKDYPGVSIVNVAGDNVTMGDAWKGDENSAHGYPDQKDFESEEDFFKACRERRVEPSESQEEMFRELMIIISMNKSMDYIKGKFTITRK